MFSFIFLQSQMLTDPQVALFQEPGEGKYHPGSSEPCLLLNYHDPLSLFFSPIISIFIIFSLSPSYFLSLSLFLLGSLFPSLTLSLYVCLPLHLSSYFCLFCLFVFLSLAFYLCLSLFFPFLCVCLYLPPVLCISYSFKRSLLYYLLFSSTLP